MEQYVKITYLNDFIFCPLSIYYHELYGSLEPVLYHDRPQIDGKSAHESIDSKNYSTHSCVLQGVDVYSVRYGLCGKIDTFDASSGVLTERKKKVSAIFDGYVFQLYAQCLCLEEMGFVVKKMRIWSKDDNRVYPISLPSSDAVMFSKFLNCLQRLNEFEPSLFQPSNPSKCKACIYGAFCDRSLEDYAYSK